jgi:hypothetical protein
MRRRRTTCLLSSYLVIAITIFLSAVSSASQRWHEGQCPVYERVNQSLRTRDGHVVPSRITIIHPLSSLLYCATSAPNKTIPMANQSARYSITHEDPYAMPFFANRPGLTASAMPSITVHVALEPPLRVRPIKRAANPPCILGPDSLVYQPRTNNQVNESTWSRHRPFTPRDRTPSVKLQSCHAVHASMCTGPNTQPGNRGVVV